MIRMGPSTTFSIQMPKVNSGPIFSGEAPKPAGARPRACSLREARQQFERDYIASVLRSHGWRMADAAQTLGIQRRNLYRKARQLGIPLPRVSQ